MLRRVSGLVLFCFSVLGVAVLAAEETFSKSFDAGDLDRLLVDNVNGNIDVEAWYQNEIEITVTKRARGTNTDEKLKHLEIVFEESDGQLTVRTKHDHSFFGNRTRGTSVFYDIRIPQSMDLDLETTNGNVFARGFSGAARLETTNGDVTVKEAKGSVDAETTNGSIAVSLVEHNGQNMRCETTNGGIRLTLPEGFHAELDAETTNGGIHSDFGVTSTSWSKHHVRGTINGGGPVLQLETTNGSIHIDKK